MSGLKDLPIWLFVIFMLMPAHSPAQTLSVDDMATRMNRQTITGATIIVHGFQASDGGGDSLMPLADAIKKKIQSLLGDPNNGAPWCWLLDLDIDNSGPNLAVGRDGGNTVFDLNQSFAPAQNANGESGHVVLLFDWAAESNERSHGWTEAAGDALFALLIKLGIVRVEQDTHIPLHFIAHSFGCAATSECVERLAHYNVSVDQVTYLDPHDFNQPIRDSLPHLTHVDTAQRQWTVGKPGGYGATVWNNVAFTDCYYQTRGIGGTTWVVDVPNGRPIPGAYNYWVNTDLPPGNPNPYGRTSSNSDHTYVWNAFYRGTILGRLPNNNDYPGADACPNPQTAPNWGQTGWAYSRFSNSGVARPAPRFYSTQAAAQSHRYSEPDLVDRTTGQPNAAGLQKRGFTLRQMDTVKAFPAWERSEIVNGNFQATGSRQWADIIPGWSHHGGGGDGDADAPGILTLNYLDDDRTHNRLFIPPNATHLEFQARRTDDGDDTVRAYIGNTEIWSLAMNATERNFITYRVAIPAQFLGKVDTIHFTLSDDPGGWNSWVSSEIKFDNLKWVVNNRPPVARDDNYRTPQNVQLIVPTPGILANDTDPDRQPVWVDRRISNPQNGQLVSFQRGGSLIYTPNPGFTGEDQFKYLATDGSSLSNVATVKIKVDPPPNNRPVGVNDLFRTGRNQLLAVNAPGVRQNDSDADGDLILSQLLSLPEHGTLYYLDEDGSFLYEPDPEFTGQDHFLYWLTDGADVSDPVTVTIEVENARPDGGNDRYTIPSFASIRVPAPGVLRNDSDPEGDEITALLDSPPGSGSLTLNSDGSFLYTPPAGSTGQDTFTYRVIDEFGASSFPVTVTIDYFDHYRVADLGLLSGTTNANAQRINDLGQVVGNSSNPSRGFFWDNCTLADMGGDFTSITPFSLNNAGIACGSAAQSGGPLRAFLWYDGSFLDLGTFGGAASEAYGMNEFTQVVGWAALPDGTAHAALWTNGMMIDLGKPEGTLASSAAEINHKDQIAGQAVSAQTGVLQAFLLENGEFMMLGTLPGYALGSYSGGINDSRQICGTSIANANETIAQAFLWENGSMTGLGTLYGLSSYSRQVNNLGQTVGRVGNGLQRRAFIHQGSTMADLNHLIPSGTGWTLMVARDINDAGQIVGLGMRGGVFKAFLLSPPVSNCILGDVNCDGCVDDADLLAILFVFGSTGDCLPEDLNRDGVVDDTDLLEVLFNFGNGC